jgi:L-asparaginase
MSSEAYTCVVSRCAAPALMIHGGAGAYLQTTSLAQRQMRGQRMLSIAQAGFAALCGPGGARAAALEAIGQMELDPSFNAGLGGKLQRDGQVRVSAALMDGASLRLSAVYNVEGCLHPSRLADALQGHGDRNLDGRGAAALMAALGVSPVDLSTPQTRARWEALVARGDTTDPESAFGDEGRPSLEQARALGLALPPDLAPLAPPERYGTVGAVALDARGQLWACTSTGGRGHETPGRVSDSPTPAGNYACEAIALSATGFGEQILDLNLCGRIATRVLDGATLEQALRRTFDEVVAHGGLLGVIALTANGEVGYAHTTEACGVAWIDPHGHHLDPHGR